MPWGWLTLLDSSSRCVLLPLEIGWNRWKGWPFTPGFFAWGPPGDCTHELMFQQWQQEKQPHESHSDDSEQWLLSKQSWPTIASQWGLQFLGEKTMAKRTSTTPTAPQWVLCLRRLIYQTCKYSIGWVARVYDYSHLNCYANQHIYAKQTYIYFETCSSMIFYAAMRDAGSTTHHFKWRTHDHEDRA